MKNMFKCLGVGIIALTTFFASGCGCSCSMKSADLNQRISDMKVQEVYRNGDNNQAFTATVKYMPDYYNDNTKTINLNFNMTSTESGLNLKRKEDDGDYKTVPQGDIASSEIVVAYDRFKTVPYNVYNVIWTRDKFNNEKSKKEPDQTLLDNYLKEEKEFINELPGFHNIDTAENNIHSLKFNANAKAEWFGGDKIYTIHYDVSALGSESFDIEIRTNKYNKLTHFSLNLYIKGRTDHNTDIEVNYNLLDVNIEYK